MKKIFRPIVIAAIIAAFVFAALYMLGKRKEEWDKKAYVEAEKKQIEEMLAPFKNDKGGADTPQEALDKYKEALFKGDIDVAMEMVFLDRKNEVRPKLEEKSAEELKKYAEGLPEGGKLEKDKEESFECRQLTCGVKYQATYHYSYWVNESKKVIVGDEMIEMPAGKYGSSIAFVQKLDNKWQLDEMP